MIQHSMICFSRQYIANPRRRVFNLCFVIGAVPACGCAFFVRNRNETMVPVVDGRFFKVMFLRFCVQKLFEEALRDKNAFVSCPAPEGCNVCSATTSKDGSKVRGSFRRKYSGCVLYFRALFFVSCFLKVLHAADEKTKKTKTYTENERNVVHKVYFGPSQYYGTTSPLVDLWWQTRHHKSTSISKMFPMCTILYAQD